MTEDPRITFTREKALKASQKILLENGVLALNHGAVSKATGISRSTLYRHWADVKTLRDATFRRIATPQNVAPRTDGPLRADLLWLLGILVDALNETPWGRVAPHVIAASTSDEEAKQVITGFMKDRFAFVEAVFQAAIERGEIHATAPINQLIEVAISVPYFRKLVLHEPLNQHWLEQHVDQICRMAHFAAGNTKE
ncbi:TetR-like C-terminal domain-containing protein [uncultured Tateyamaria sp.]|uniref:TetR-like C-terminal domain-containing protein n=1 Tax=uncultured Tateyamaria sp. TaxID=455651 RepID=UPI002632F46F|nr:TetR-like C-terminal domain-containing protein [uncultured Tateyamaria sp.]